ncbi:hypothetical protein [Flammeovirga sp. EKP202]|uniref:hypothetical protein n=1 Tax=Flammeovirga sp. EKP202 TaxID=2770592 RepID=UPI00165F07D3|nr:hypothetical protein [Flammeovirga sp. EKP202]MBD0403218.1 hypothetical protein [Flammeovirga sp. EKP202]
MKKSQVTLTLTGTTDKEIAEAANCLQVFAETITVDNMKLLATKANKKGINQKIKKFHTFI